MAQVAASFLLLIIRIYPLGGDMRRGTEISCFTLLVLLLVLFTAIPTHAATVNVSLNADGTNGYVFGQDSQVVQRFGAAGAGPNALQLL